MKTKPIKPIPTPEHLEVLYSQIGAVARRGDSLIVRPYSGDRLEFYSPVAAWHWWKEHPRTVARLVVPVEKLN